ncbi:hypothetical protein CEXT_737451 [Caerostris extrusa]|uniref:Uncharacterized protein n=1 Tax=Caerostris extrusa TaxID=172846 RepID=A0AAV4XSR7_CAEEX|nr:hypothetical protein CEXT_737451 [Caerostris extrusa]
MFSELSMNRCFKQSDSIGKELRRKVNVLHSTLHNPNRQNNCHCNNETGHPDHIITDFASHLDESDPLCHAKRGPPVKRKSSFKVFEGLH